MYGVVWSARDEEIAQTGYVFPDVEAARQAGIKGCQWFSNQQGHIDHAVGASVDWTSDSGAMPVSFFVDTDDDTYAEYETDGTKMRYAGQPDWTSV